MRSYHDNCSHPVPDESEPVLDAAAPGSLASLEIQAQLRCCPRPGTALGLQLTQCSWHAGTPLSLVVGRCPGLPRGKTPEGAQQLHPTGS